MILFDQIASGSKGNCYILSHGTDKLMLECGISPKNLRGKIDFPITDVCACLVSHQHKDHAGYVPAMIRKSIDIFAHKSVFDSFGIERCYLAHPVENKKHFSIGCFNIIPFDVLHDVPNFGFLISAGKEKLLFATDTPYLKYQFKKLTKIAIECNFQADILSENVNDGTINRSLRRRINKNHFSLDRLLVFLERTDLSMVSEINLLHLSKNNANPIEIKEIVQMATGIPTIIK